MMRSVKLIFILCTLALISCTSQPKEEGKAFDAYGPADYLWERWAFPNETFDEAYFDQVFKKAKQTAYEKDGQNEVSWRMEGPHNIGGRINVVVLNPDDEDEIWIGTSAGGVFKTSDAGESWLPIGDSFSNLSIGSIAFDPSNSSTVYVGTGDPNISGYPKTGDGVYKTEDGGDNWESLGLEELGVISKIIVDSDDSDILYLASMGTPYYESADRGIYKSDDGGESWNQILFLAESAGISSMVAHPNNPDTLYAAGWDRIRSNTQSIVSGDHSRIYRSYDGGISWDTLSGGLPQEYMSRAAIDISLSNPEVLYASFVNDEDMQFYGVYRSDDNGDSWTETETGFLDGALGGFGWYFGMVRINPTDENNVHVAGVELHSTIDSGDTWYQSTPNWWEYVVHADMHDLAYSSSGDIYLATDGGLYVSYNNMASWEYISYIPITQFYRVTVNPHEDEVYAGGAQDNGTSAGNYEGLSEWPRIYGGDGFKAIYHPDDEDIMLATTQNGFFHISFDGGEFFDSYNTGIDGEERVAWDAPIINSSHESEVLYTGTTRVYKTLGLSWFPISDELVISGEYYPANRYVLTTIAESSLDADVLYTGSSDGGVWGTENGGGDWTDISEGLPERYVTDIKASSEEEGRVYITQSGYKDGDDVPHIYRSDDYGQTWEGIGGDLPDFGLNNVEILEGHADSILFVASDGGVYYTVNSGETWDRVGDNMPFILVFDIEIDYDANRLVAGTFSRSIQSISLDSLFDFSTSIKEQEAFVFSLYPNPVVDELTINMVDGDALSKWQILDGQGRMIKAGTLQEKAISVSELPTGVYFLRIENDKGSSIRKWIKRG